MSFYAGLTAGWGQGVGERNKQMMDYFTQKSQTMSRLYEGLANSLIQSGGDQDIAMEFLNRAKGWGTANPLFDTKGYQQLLKGEKTGIHDIIESTTKRKLQQAQTMPQYSPSEPDSVGEPFGTQSLSIPNLMKDLLGGQPQYGSMGMPTYAGKMAMSALPNVIQDRMAWNHKAAMMQNLLQGKSLEDMPPGEAETLINVARGMGINLPVPQIRHIPRALYIDPTTGKYQLGPVRVNFRNSAAWVEGPNGEQRVTTVDENPQLSARPDGSVWALTTAGAFPIDGRLPVQTGSQNSTSPTPGGGTAVTQSKTFSTGQSAAPDPVPDGIPTVGTVLPPGLNPGLTSGPPAARTSTQKPSEAYVNKGGFSLEKLETSLDPTDRQVAAYITHPESFDVPATRREMWNYEFNRRTNGAISQAPVPLREFRMDFAKQRSAIVSGFHASKNISNILNSTDGVLVGMIAGRWVDFMNTVGSAKGITALGDNEAPTVESIKQVMPQIAQQRPELAHRLNTQSDILAQKAADLITTMRLFNFADVRNTIGGVQGVSSVYKFLKSSLMNPGMDMPLILGHLSSLNRNMADGLLVLEQARWGNKIPYIREKELLAEAYWDPHVEQLVKKLQAAAAEKGSNLSRQDALFALWRNGKIEADPGNSVDVQKVSNP